MRIPPLFLGRWMPIVAALRVIFMVIRPGELHGRRCGRNYENMLLVGLRLAFRHRIEKLLIFLDKKNRICASEPARANRITTESNRKTDRICASDSNRLSY